jgi:hypothetical protein
VTVSCPATPRPNATTAARPKNSKGSKPCTMNYRTNPFSRPNQNKTKPLVRN